MKQAIAIMLLLALFAGIFAGCARTNYRYADDMPYRGNVSTTNNGYVNGTNDRFMRDDTYDTYDPNVTRDRKDVPTDRTVKTERGMDRTDKTDRRK